MAPITCFVSHTLRVSMRRKLRTGPLREPIIQGELVFLLVVSGLLLKTCLGLCRIVLGLLFVNALSDRQDAYPTDNDGRIRSR